MKRKISALAAVLLAIGLTACGNNNSQVSADATQNMQIESSVETENTNNTEEAEQTVTGEDALNATDEIVEDTSSEATESSEEDGGTLVVYFSATGTTKRVAEKIAGIALETTDLIKGGHMGISFLYAVLSVFIGIAVVFGIDMLEMGGR